MKRKEHFLRTFMYQEIYNYAYILKKISPKHPKYCSILMSMISHFRSVPELK